jgi:membrane fusion protein, heavy metal efflux system
MTRTSLNKFIFCAFFAVLQAGCGADDPNAGAPPPLKVEHAEDASVFQVAHPEQFPLTAAIEHVATSQLRVTGTVSPDVSRNVPVVSLASGRVIDVAARLGDTVQKGQLLLRIQSADVSSAYSDYQKAVADERLARTQLDRAKGLYEKGAISLNEQQVAQDAADKAKVDVDTTAEKLRVLGSPNLDQPTGIIEIRAPISGVITDQQITASGGVQGLSSPNAFTISDLSNVWILCDVYENDLSKVRVGQKAEVTLNAFPGKSFTGIIGNIGAVLDPNLRTVKVRLEVHNSGQMRPGMFVTAVFHGQDSRKLAAVPATAILHLHDRDWVYVSAGANKFRLVEITGGDMLPGNLQEILSGISPGQQVVTNALELQNTVGQ